MHMWTYIMLIEALRLLVQATCKYCHANYEAMWEVWTVHEWREKRDKEGGWVGVNKGYKWYSKINNKHIMLCAKSEVLMVVTIQFAAI